MPVAHAYRLLKKHWIKPGTHRLLLPIDPTAIAIAEKLEVMPLPKVEWELSGKFDPHRGLIMFNPFDSINRQRFTIAHELGHIAMDHRQACRDPRIKSDLFDYDPREEQANKFAEALLMPTFAIKYLIDEKEITDARRLREILGVSRDTLRIRLENMGYA